MSSTAVDIIIRTLVAAALGGLIGLEREMRDRPAGVRTHILVALGACVFTTMSLFGFPGSVGGDRVAAAVVTGIGFIGAGAILRSEHGYVSGVTTAASLWAAAAIGMVIGVGFFKIGLIVTAIALIVLEIVNLAARLLTSRYERRRMLLMVCGVHSEGLIDEVHAVLESYGVNSSMLSLKRSREDNRVDLSLRIQTKASLDIDRVTDELLGIREVSEVAWD